MVDINVKQGRFYLGDLVEAWDEANLVGNPTNKYFEIADPLTGRRLEFTGMNFEPLDGGVPTIGVIESITYYHHDGSVSWEMTKLHISVAEFQEATEGSSYATPANLQTFLGQTGFNFDRGFHFNGSIGDDIFNGGYGTDVIRGGEGVDQISGGFQRDVMYGGGRDFANPVEMDVLTYAAETGGDEITVNLEKGTVVDTNGFTDKIGGFEIIIGTTSADSFIAGDRDVFHGFVGGLGDDTIKGGAGKHDVVFYDRMNTGAINVTASAADLSVTGSGIGVDSLTDIDIIVGSAAADTMAGTSGRETFTGGNGLDKLDGGNGIDTLDFSLETGTFGIVTNLFMGFAIDTFHSGLGSSSSNIEVAVNFENVVGSSHDDYISGDGDGNRLKGGDGEDEISGLGDNDTLLGDGGNDWLEGGLGRDFLIGGAGNDIFHFTKEDGLTKKGNLDTIVDFDTKSDDIINLADIDSNPGPGNQAFAFIGSKEFSGKVGELRTVIEGKDTWVYGNTDTNDNAEFVIHLEGAIKLNAGDFML